MKSQLMVILMETVTISATTMIKSLKNRIGKVTMASNPGSCSQEEAVVAVAAEEEAVEVRSLLVKTEKDLYALTVPSSLEKLSVKTTLDLSVKMALKLRKESANHHVLMERGLSVLMALPSLERPNVKTELDQSVLTVPRSKRRNASRLVLMEKDQSAPMALYSLGRPSAQTRLDLYVLMVPRSRERVKAERSSRGSPPAQTVKDLYALTALVKKRALLAPTEPKLFARTVPLSRGTLVKREKRWLRELLSQLLGTSSAGST